MLPMRDNFDDLVRDFRWEIPARFNIGVAACDVWAARESGRTALIDYDGGQPVTHSYGSLRDRSNALANGLRRLGVKRGDRVALLVPQGLDALTGHIAIYKLGAIAVPLALLFGREALGFRLRFAGVSAVIANAKGAENIAMIEAGLPDLRFLIETEPTRISRPSSGDWRGVSLASLIEGESALFDPADTGPDDPALMIFTSGTTGPPKGALHGHRVLLGHMPGFEMAYRVAAGGRSDVDAGRLGLGRRTAQRAVAGAGSGHARPSTGVSSASSPAARLNAGERPEGHYGLSSRRLRCEC
jgi:acetyl-CoA synthetase